MYNCSGSLWAGKKVGILATQGYEGAYATDPFETGVKRLCKHSDLQYIGIILSGIQITRLRFRQKRRWKVRESSQG